MADYTNFCVRSGGSVMNAGTVDGSTTEPAAAALVTYTGGDWNSGTDVFTAAVGADMTEAQVGRFASLYVDGDTAPTTNQFLIARITNVNAGTRQITLSTTARALKGTEVATGTGNRSLKVGGAWPQPTGATVWPFDSAVTWTNLTNASGHTVRFNVKNDANLDHTAAGTFTCAPGVIQGYTTTYGDGGKFTYVGPTTGAAFTPLTLASTAAYCEDFNLKNNGDTGGNGVPLLRFNGNSAGARRGVVSNCRGSGLHVQGTGCVCEEVEAYDCNQSNTANQGGLHAAGANAQFIRCVAHANAGTNGTGFIHTGTGSLTLINCVSHGNGRDGAFAVVLVAVGCDFYDNGAANAIFTTVGVLNNCNSFAAGTYDVGGTVTAYVTNCLFGAGTMAAGTSKYQTSARAVESGNADYAADATPWSDPANGVFNLTGAAAKGTGRGTFTQTETGQGDTVGYPDIGAAQHQESGGASTVVVPVAQVVYIGPPGSGVASY